MAETVVEEFIEDDVDSENEEFEKYLHDIGFFFPSEGLAARMAEALDVEHAKDVQRTLLDPQQTREISEEELNLLLDLHGMTREQFENWEDPKTCVKELREYVASQFYGGMARLSRSPHNTRGFEWTIQEFAKPQLAGVFGMDFEESILNDFLSEFTEWFKQKQELTMAWGSIKYIDEAKFYIVSTIEVS